MPAPDDGEFDASLGLIIASSWWKLGKRIAEILAVGGDARHARLETWCRDIRTELAREKNSEPTGGINPRDLFAFVAIVLEVLERKYDGKDISADVQRLTKNGASFTIEDRGQYVQISETRETFWAVEYDFLFIRLDRSLGGGGWLNAVTRCEDPQCDVFFIKSRIDQRHHTAACRTRSANRKAYAIAAGPPRGKRGRPRLGGHV